MRCTDQTPDRPPTPDRATDPAQAACALAYARAREAWEQTRTWNTPEWADRRL